MSSFRVEVIVEAEELPPELIELGKQLGRLAGSVAASIERELLPSNDPSQTSPQRDR